MKVFIYDQIVNLENSNDETNNCGSILQLSTLSSIWSSECGGKNRGNRNVNNETTKD